jgi:hypothetical protein
MKCPTCGRDKRSNPQNARLHKLFTEIAANLPAKDGLYHPMLWWKANMVAEWIGFDEYKKVTGETFYSLKHTSSLTTDEFNDFMMRVEEYANNRGVYLDE